MFVPLVIFNLSFFVTEKVVLNILNFNDYKTVSSLKLRCFVPIIGFPKKEKYQEYIENYFKKYNKTEKKSL